MLPKIFRNTLIRFLFCACFVYIHFVANGNHFLEVPKAKRLTQFPFILTSRGIIIIKGQFSNFRDTLNFVLDTGSGGISLDSTVANRFNLTPVATKGTINGISQKKKAEFIFDQSLKLPGLEVKHLNFHVNDYAFLSEAHNIRIDGVIGYSFLQSYIVKVNYDTRKIEVFSPGAIHYPKDGYVVKTTANKLAPIETTVEDDRKIDSRFYFDTGADMCFLIADKFINDSSVFGNNKKMVVSTAKGLGGKKEMQLTTVKEIHIGPYILKKVPAYVFEDSYNISNYPHTAGIIGNELLSRFNVVINYPAGEIHLSPNSIFNTPFNYSYTGCTVGMENGKVLIRDVIEDSPAHIAGLKNDDVIYGIDDNFSNDIDEYRTLLAKTGAKLKVFLLRGNQVESTVVEVKSIL